MTDAQLVTALESTNSELARQLDELNDANEVLRAIVRTLEDVETVVSVTARCRSCGDYTDNVQVEHARVGDRFRDAIRTAVGRSAGPASARGLPDDTGLRVDREGQQRAPEGAVGGAAAIDQPRAGLRVLPIGDRRGLREQTPHLGTRPMEDVVREHELQLTQQAIALRELWTQVFPFTPWPL